MGVGPSDTPADLSGSLDPADLDAYARFAMRTRSALARARLRESGHTATLGRVITLDGGADSHEQGLSILDGVVAQGGVRSLSGEDLSVWAALLLRAGRDDELREVLEVADLPLSDIDRWMLRSDLANPHRLPAARTGTAADLEVAEATWLGVLNEIHAPDGLSPVELLPATDGARPYQRLTSTGGESIDGELVTVVMSAYTPDEDLHVAVRGVLEQTWRNIELLIVDDASGPGSAALLDEVEALDDRVRVVRATRNGGTYEARNLALTIAQGRWMTFQDSDDWTHPSRVEHQVRHLLDFPKVLGNRTWTLRAYPDLTMTYVGYLAKRLNASSLLFDRPQVTRLVGRFDATRKSGDMELPLRLRAVRPGSVRDLSHPSPLAITQLRSGSLSRDDAIPGWTRWDRLAYRHSYLEWHERIASGRLDAVPPPTGRPFPLPRHSWHPDRDDLPRTTSWDVVVLGDIRPNGRDSLRALGLARTAAHAGLRTAIAHAEAPNPLTAKRLDLMADVSTDVRLGRIGLTDTHEEDHVGLLVVTNPESLLHLDEVRLDARSVLIVTDEDDAASWSPEAVDKRARQLMGRPPIWGGPVGVHGTASRVRSAIPQDRWCEADLARVVGAGWLPVGTTSSRAAAAALAGPLVVGHHLEDAPERWPSPATVIRTAYPDEIAGPSVSGASRAVEVHCLHGLSSVTTSLGRRLPPPSWLSFTGTGMTTREFLSHLDVWVYFGVWDRAAEHAALEALGAGLPCLLGEEAASSRLPGLVRHIAPEAAGSALEGLLASPSARAARAALGALGAREAEWTRTLRALALTPTDERPPRAPDHA